MKMHGKHSMKSVAGFCDDGDEYMTLNKQGISQ
jgi:hypothetical protein